MNETEFKAGDYIFHSSFGVGKIMRPAEREGKPGFELDFKNRTSHFMSLDILRRTQRDHPDGLRVFAFEHKVEALRLMQEDPAAVIIRAIGQSSAPLERPDIERVLIESTLVSSPEQFKIWWGKALPKLKNSVWLDITLQGSKVLVRRLETPRAVPVPPAPSANSTPVARPSETPKQTPAPTNDLRTTTKTQAVSRPIPPARTSTPATPSNTTLPFDLADFRRQLRLIEPEETLSEEAKEYLLQVASKPMVAVTLQFEALVIAYQKKALSKVELLVRIEEKANGGLGLERIEDARIRNEVALLLLEESVISPTLLRWLRGSFISDLALAELVLDRLVELRQFEILGKSIEQVTTNLDNDPTRLARELDFVRWIVQKEPNLANLALGSGYPWPPASLTTRIIQLLTALMEMEPRDEASREARKEGLVEVARLLESRSVERDPATITRVTQALAAMRSKNERVVESFALLLSQPDRPLVPRLVKYLELNLSVLEDSPLISIMLQLEVGRSERSDFGLVHWWLGQAVRLKSLKLARSLFDFLLLRLNRALDENEQLRCLMLLSQMIDLELINQNQAAPLQAMLKQLFQKMATRKIKTDEENGFMLNELIVAFTEVLSRLERQVHQALMDKESAEEEARTLRYAAKAAQNETD
ncbi:MAG: hypothetical protein WCS37_17185 [Chloroflexota bacterium]|nr:hypothetical protein [Chloroflexota bacterium]